MREDGTKTCVITGAASGLGLETAKQLAASGLRIIGIGAEPGPCRGAEAEIRALRPRAGVRYIVGDLASLAGIRRAAAAVRDDLAGGRLDRLIHGAATFTDAYTSTADGFELQFAVNYLAAFLLTRELFRCLIRPKEARVITVSSGSHRRTSVAWADPMLRRKYSGLKAYRQSKLALVVFTLELNRRVAFRFPVRGIGVEPGGLDPIIPRLAAAGSHGRTVLSPADAATAVARLAACPPASVPADYWRLGRPAEPSPYARGADTAVRLWRLSEKLCGADFL
jgi:NAD(P)-dependent dehydrogenase (short-subunit alcohol dehydrogenase family)